MSSPNSSMRRLGSPRGNDTERSFYESEVDTMNAVEQSKRLFLQSFGDYIETIKRSTEASERQQQTAQFEQRLEDNCKRALGTASSASLPVPTAKAEYKHLPSLIENARGYTASPKYAEWHTGINKALPHLEEALAKLRVLDIPSAEKDIVDPVRTAVNTPFMQMIKCKEKQREFQSALTQGVLDSTSYAGHIKALYGEFQTNHRERKMRQALELVKRMETAVQAADGNFMARLESYSEAKRLMGATLDAHDPLNIHDYEPPRDKALSALETKLAEVSQTRAIWVADLENLQGVNRTDDTISTLKKKAAQSAEAHKGAAAELKLSNEGVQKCWDALMEAQSRAARAEKFFIATKLQEDTDARMVADVSARVESQKAMFYDNIQSCDQYCEVLRQVQRYINMRWEPWRDIVKMDTKGLVVEVCEVFSISEKVLGDLIDRKQAQVDHAAKEEKDCLEKYHRKWDQLDPNADQEKARAHEAQAVKETAQREVERLTRLRQGMREVVAKCRPVIEYFGISINSIERVALMEEWDKKRVRVYKEFEDIIEPCVVRINVMGQTPDAQLQDIKAAAQEEYKRLNSFLAAVPDHLAAPLECRLDPTVEEKQRLTIGDMIQRVTYMCQELDRHGTSAKALESGLASIKRLGETLKGGPSVTSSVYAIADSPPETRQSVASEDVAC